MPLPMFRDLLDALDQPRRLVLNYSGESTHHPDLLPAIAAARATGAYVELVSVLMPVPDDQLPAFATAGLSRLTVSIHATTPGLFTEIYRHGSFPLLERKLRRLAELRAAQQQPPVLDLAFVAMERNLGELPRVATLARSIGIDDLYIFPLLRRDPIPELFQIEVDPAGCLQPAFRARVAAEVDAARQSQPDLRVTICNPLPEGEPAPLGAIPVDYPWPLPPGAAIHHCEQNPWETAHVLSNGDVVSCEVLDHEVMGNLAGQSLRDIWHGPRYRQFREQYRAGAVPACQTCPWKSAYLPEELQPEILAVRGASAQLHYGWHRFEDDGHIWAAARAAALLAAPAGAALLHVSGMLPPGPEGAGNELEIRCGGRGVGAVHNPYEEVMRFGLDFPVDAGAGPWLVEFRTRHVFRAPGDQRDLGFALVLAAAKPAPDPEGQARRLRALAPLEEWIHRTDRWAVRAAPLLPHLQREPLPPQPGVTVVVPERAGATYLGACLQSIEEASAELAEPVQVIVVVNGSPAADYRELRARFPRAAWQFHRRPLGFSGAVAAGLRAARHPWVYLLNNDARLGPGALAATLAERAPDVFGVASQIYLEDPTRYRDETNWADLEEHDGLISLADRIPDGAGTVPCFYAGGGASLFQTRALARLVDPRAFPDFYWEDAEWGWRARKLGYRVLFCARSEVRHQQGATVRSVFSSTELAAMRTRNRAMVQLRNWTSLGRPERVLELIAGAPNGVAEWFQRSTVRWAIARGRLWSRRATISDVEVMETWKRSSTSTC